MKQKEMDTKFQKRLVLVCLIGFLLMSVQICSGFTNSYQLTASLTIAPSTVPVNSTTTITVHIFDPYHPDVFFANAQGILYKAYPSSGTLLQEPFTTDATGTYTTTFSPPYPGTYEFQVDNVCYNYNLFGPPFSTSNVGSKCGWSGVYFLTANKVATISNKVVVQQVVTAHPVVSMTSLIIHPVTSLPIPQTTTQGPQPSTDQLVTTSPSTPTQTSSNPPSSVSDSIPPVTTLTVSGTSDGSGGYTSDVTGTLTAADNDGGSGVNLIQYSFDGASWFTYTQPFSVVKQGMTTVYYRSADNAGNTELAKVKAILISGPGTSSTGSQDQPGTTTAAQSLPASATAKNSIPWVSGEMTVCTILAGAALFMYKKAAR
jgi:hypothetical protein